MAMPNDVAIPAKADARWANLVTSGPSQPPKSLALKFMLTRMNQDVKQDPSAQSVAKTVDELYGFFIKNPRMVAVDCSTFFA